jgi:hypothetical protein
MGNLDLVASGSNRQYVFVNRRGVVLEDRICFHFPSRELQHMRVHAERFEWSSETTGRVWFDAT